MLLSFGLLCRAGDSVSNFDCAALRAMTDQEWEIAFRLFVILMQLLKLCGAIHNFACFPNVLPMGCCFIVSQGVAIGLG